MVVLISVKFLIFAPLLFPQGLITILNLGGQGTDTVSTDINVDRDSILFLAGNRSD